MGRLRNSSRAARLVAALVLVGLTSCRPAGRSGTGHATVPPVAPRTSAAESPPSPGAPPAGEGAATPARDDDRREAIGPLSPPEPRPGGYVGSRACASCHAAISEAFAAHPMGRSMDSVPPERPIETSLVGGFRDREREYRVEVTDGEVIHHERGLGADGTEIYDQGLPVRFAVGSGTRGRSYLIEHDGLLFQSPIGWFTAADAYGLSPGYRHDRSLRFERRIGDGCLHCHAGLVEHVEEGAERYSGRVFMEASIGCERCHGPGERHVEAMNAAAALGEKPVDTCIVNPEDLEPRKREAVCNQCHLGGEATVPRFGRGFYDFRPGDHLDDTLLVFVQDEKAWAASGDKPVSQVEQMRQSACWKGTGGAIGCISCHDPHAKPRPEEKEAFYRAKCNACHAERPCTLPEIERLAAPAGDSCTACHMPSQSLREVAHTAMTDHSVPRRPGEASGRPPASATADLVAFDDAGERVPARELERARGIALASRPSSRRSTRAAVEAVRALVPQGVDVPDTAGIVRALAGDAEALRGLGRLFSQTGRLDAAAACWEEALEARPDDGETLSLLSNLLQRAGRLPEALSMLERLLATHGWMAADHAQRGALLVALGRPEEAIPAVRRSLELDPSSLQVRAFLVDLLANTGRTREAEEERGILERLSAAAGTAAAP